MSGVAPADLVLGCACWACMSGWVQQDRDWVWKDKDWRSDRPWSESHARVTAGRDAKA